MIDRRSLSNHCGGQKTSDVYIMVQVWGGGGGVPGKCLFSFLLSVEEVVWRGLSNVPKPVTEYVLRYTPRENIKRATK